MIFQIELLIFLFPSILVFQILRIAGSPSKPFELFLGRIFGKLRSLEQITLNYCGIPAIGYASFWPGHKIRTIDLSYNQIDIIKEGDFKGLSNLTDLDLSSNRISDPPSAPFNHLKGLERLSLANNQLTKLVPRMFFQLQRLESLNLSGNPLTDIHPDDIKDVVGLKQLFLGDCRLSRIHSLIFTRLSSLELLDLSNNQFQVLSQNEFKSLAKLRILKLSGNQLLNLQDYTFNGLSLQRLLLDHNQIRTLGSCVFCNSSIRIVNLSENHLTFIDSGVFTPLADSVQILNLSNNSQLTDSITAIENAIKPLRKLARLYLASTGIDERLHPEIFQNSGETLRILDVSNNRFINLSHLLFNDLKKIEILDLSNNRMQGMNLQMIRVFRSLVNLKYLNLEGPNWSCYRCHIIDLRDWLITRPSAYESVCRKGSGSCVRCSVPSDLYGQHVSEVDEFSLEWCPDPTIKLRLSTSEPRVGMVLALIIIVTLVVVIIIVIFMYKHRGGSYYTHEDDRLDAKTIFTIQQTAAATQTPPDLSTTTTTSSPSKTITNSQDSCDSSTSEQSAQLPSLPLVPPPPPPPPPLLQSAAKYKPSEETKPKMRY